MNTIEQKAKVNNTFGFGKLTLECVSCTQTEKKDGYILKLLHQHEIKCKTPFGEKVQPVQHTFYMKVADECAVGFKAEMDTDTWRITERPFDIVDENSGEVTTVQLKWLHLAE